MKHNLSIRKAMINGFQRVFCRVRYSKSIVDLDNSWLDTDYAQCFDAGRYDSAREIALRAAEKGDPGGMYILALSYYLGSGVPQDLDLAESWAKQAIAHGEKGLNWMLDAIAQKRADLSE